MIYDDNNNTPYIILWSRKQSNINMKPLASPKTQAVARAGEKTRGLRPRNSPRGAPPIEHKIVIDINKC